MQPYTAHCSHCSHAAPTARDGVGTIAPQPNTKTTRLRAAPLVELYGERGQHRRDADDTLSLKVDKGDRVALVGPNGSGRARWPSSSASASLAAASPGAETTRRGGPARPGELGRGSQLRASSVAGVAPFPPPID